LNRNPDYLVYGTAEIKKARSIERAESGFNSISMKERGKIKEETISNWGGTRLERKATQSRREVDNELIVVTILVAAAGTVKLPKILSKSEMDEALNK